jgi:hypothetical protein
MNKCNVSKIAPYFNSERILLLFITEWGGNLGEEMQKERLENGRARQKKFKESQQLAVWKRRDDLNNRTGEHKCGLHMTEEHRTAPPSGRP